MKVGDRVLILAKIEGLYESEYYCNVQLKTELRRRPDGEKESICLDSINTGVLLRNNPDDENDIGVIK